MPPKDFIVYIDPENTTRAVLNTHEVLTRDTCRQLESEGCYVVAHVSAPSEVDAIAYVDQTLL